MSLRRKAVFTYIPNNSPQATAVGVMLFLGGRQIGYNGGLESWAARPEERNGGNVSEESFEELWKALENSAGCGSSLGGERRQEASPPLVGSCSAILAASLKLWPIIPSTGVQSSIQFSSFTSISASRISLSSYLGTTTCDDCDPLCGVIFVSHFATSPHQCRCQQVPFLDVPTSFGANACGGR